MSLLIPYSSKHLVKEKLCSANPFTLDNILVSLHQQSIVPSITMLPLDIFHGRIRGPSLANFMKFFLKDVVHCSFEFRFLNVIYFIRTQGHSNACIFVSASIFNCRENTLCIWIVCKYSKSMYGFNMVPGL